MEPSGAFPGALAGLLVGEAFALPYDLVPAAEIPPKPEWTGGGNHARLPGTYGEAGGMALATTESLLDRGKFDPDDMAQRWVRWWAEGVMASDEAVFDVEETTEIALQAIAEGVDPRQAALSGEGARGSGSLIRVLPAAFLPEGIDEGDAVRQAAAISKLTQAHPEVRAACGLFVVLLRRLAAGARTVDAMSGAIESLPGHLEPVQDRELVESARALAADPTLVAPGDSGYVLDLLGSAWNAMAGSENLEATLSAAVRHGGRSAHRGALAGALGGARWGLAAVPATWRRKLRLDEAGKALLARLKLAPASRL